MNDVIRIVGYQVAALTIAVAALTMTLVEAPRLVSVVLIVPAMLLSIYVLWRLTPGDIQRRDGEA